MRQVLSWHLPRLRRPTSAMPALHWPEHTFVSSGTQRTRLIGISRLMRACSAGIVSIPRSVLATESCASLIGIG